MKNRIIFALLILSVHSFAQQTGTFDFQLIVPNEDGIDTMTIHIAQTSKKFAANFSGDGVIERFVLDSIAGQVVELIDEDGDREAYVTSLSSLSEDDDLTYGYTTVSDFILGDIASKEDYTLLSDKKVIQGWDCRKVNLLEDGKVVGIAWVAMGLYIGFSNEVGFFRIPEGTIVELIVKENGVVSGEMKLIQSKKTIANSAVEFSLAIPDGYELYDDEEYYDEEYGDEEEGE